MVSLVKKKIKGNLYYYARESKRVNGKPKIVWQKYLGRAEDIVDAVEGPQPQHAVVRDFAALAALLDVARELDIVECVDRYAPKRGSGPSVGTYILIAILNRCVAPCSKAAIADWFRQTVLARLLGINPNQLSSQRFWDNMDRIEEHHIPSIERDIVARMVKDHDVDLGRVLFDATNFFTFIDTYNEAPELAQRGHSKQGRKALRIVGLALLVSRDSHLPLFHHAFPGNQHDATTFASLVDALVARCRDITDQVENITLIFDKGNNSADNIAAVDKGPYNFTGSLVPTHHRDLLDMTAESLAPLEDFDGVRARRVKRHLFGAERTVVVTWNRNLFDAQTRTLKREIAKRRRHLRDLQAALRRWHTGETNRGSPPTVEGTRKKVEQWLKARHMKQLFKVDVAERDGLPVLTYRFDRDEWENLKETLLGKTLVFTDNHDWSDAEIVGGYRAQHHVEAAFRQMKDTRHIALRLQYHWTDQKIRVHVLCCVLALMLIGLLHRKVRKRGFDISATELVDRLAAIREVGVVYERRGKKTDMQMTLSQMDDEDRELFDALDLKRHLSS